MFKLKLDSKKNYKYFDGYVDINGIKQYILVYPKNESDVALVHLHGGPGEADSVYVPLKLPDYLPANLIYFDQRGAGKTQLLNKTDPKDITLDNLISDLHELIAFIKKELNIPKIVLVGHSFGTILAHEFINKYPHDAVATIAVGAVISLISGEKLNMDELSTIVMQKGMDKDKTIIEELKKVNYPFVKPEEFLPNLRKLRKIFWTYRPSFSNNYGKYKLLFKSYTMHRKDLSWVDNVELQMKNNQMLLSTLLTYDISKETSYPTQIYFISGEKDYICPTQLVIEHFQKLTNEKAAMYTIPYAAHSPQYDNPKEYWNVINAILFNIFNTPLKG